MKPVFDFLSRMVFFMSVPKLLTSARSGQSEKSQSPDFQQLSTLAWPQCKLDKSFTESMASSLALTKAKASNDLRISELEMEIAQAQQKMYLPHRIYGATLKHDGLEWVAMFGYDEQGQPQLVGRGASPAAALNDFDHKWYGLETE